MSNPWQPERWQPVAGFDFTDISYHRAVDVPAVRIAFDRPEVRNAFRPHTVDELYAALDHARTSSDVGCVLITGNGPSAKDGGWAFCSGGDQRIRGRAGYQYAEGESAETVDAAMLRSQTTCSEWPPPAAQPFTRAMTTFGMNRISRCTSRMCSRPSFAASTVSADSPSAYW
jgi:1,4-dihydroxy-2-naphthoyl-CoA synthase